MVAIPDHVRKDPAKLERLKLLLTQQKRGFRSNWWIDQIRGPTPDNPYGVTTKQRWFLNLADVKEMMFGGSRGDGKSDALLIAAMQFVDVPGYAAALFRKTYEDLNKPGGLMQRAGVWFSRFTGRDVPLKYRVVKMDGGRKWKWPSGAVIQFGYLSDEEDRYHWQGAEVQFLGFDELTHISMENYLYVHSSLRRLKGMDIPLRIRAASNPNGPYVEWVKDRFITRRYLEADEETQFAKIWEKRTACKDCGETGILRGETCVYCEGKGYARRLFLPARIQDNPYLDIDAYRREMAELPYHERQQLEHGRWDITPDGLVFKTDWLRFYSTRGEHICLDDGTTWASTDIEHFITADTASKEKTLNDYTVICVWAFHRPSRSIALRFVFRGKPDFPEMVKVTKRLYQQWKCTYAVIEDASSGIALIQTLRSELNTVAYPVRGQDPVSRASHAALQMEQGKVYFPSGDPYWLAPFISEVIGFGELEHDDCVSAFSVAGWYVANQNHIHRPMAPPVEVSSPPSLVGGAMFGEMNDSGLDIGSGFDGLFGSGW